MPSRIRLIVVFFSATKTNLSKQFPNVSSESDLQRYRTSHSHERKSPSLSNQINSGNQKVCIVNNIAIIRSCLKFNLSLQKSITVLFVVYTDTLRYTYTICYKKTMSKFFMDMKRRHKLLQKTCTCFGKEFLL